MNAVKDNTTPRPAEQVADPTRAPASNLVSSWARGRRRITPRAYPHMRALGAVRLAVGLFLVVLAALLFANGQAGWALIPLAGAAVNVAIGGLDTAAGFSAPHRA
jgi:hypothetical protein